MTELSTIEKKSTDVMARANALQITSPPEYLDATDFLKAVKALQREIASSFNPIVDAAHKAHKEAISQRDVHLKPVKDAEAIIKGKVSDYAAKQERARKAEQDRLDEDAQKERDEGLRLALEASEVAERLKAQGDHENAVAVQQEAMKMAEEAVKIEAPKVRADKVDGVSFRQSWEIEITDPDAVPREWCVPDESAIRQYVKATKGRKEIAGVKITEKKTTAVRGELKLDE